MAVIVFMYHDTPKDAVETSLDVRLDVFKAQIKAMVDAGVSIIPFSRANDADVLEGGKHAVITFDDGNGSNADAMTFLHDQGITGTQFIVANWARTGIGYEGKPGYLEKAAIADLAAIGEFGGHGANHIALANRTRAELEDELSQSRGFVEDIIGKPVTTMSFPGGSFDAQAVTVANDVGFDVIGNSVFDINVKKGATVNRLVVDANADADWPLRMMQRPVWFWGARRQVCNLVRR
jgi:peptidoglycan/xylan/chitin deacetylase (PgdA/CDA1 family)